MHPTTETTRTGYEAECEACSSIIPGGEVVLLNRTLYCTSCGLVEAAKILSPLLVPCWTPADIDAGRREYEEARVVLLILSARIAVRLAERV